MNGTHTPPTQESPKFNCPHCGVFSRQIWSPFYPEITLGNVSGSTSYKVSTHNSAGKYEAEMFHVCVCYYCNKFSIWYLEKMIHPAASVAPLPSSDLPEDLKKDYEEARTIATQSPRGAAALMRLVIQKLCVELGESGRNINTDIKELVKKGLPEKIQKALDTVRVVGNNAVHPGTIDISDTPETAYNLFSLVNIIVQFMITQPRMVDAIYEQLPESSKEAIEKRDNY